MTFALSGNVITQAGVDTSLAGLSAIFTGAAVVARTTAYSVNTIIKPVAATGLLYRCTVAGTTVAVEPAYGATVGNVTADGTASFVAFSPPTSEVVGSKIVYKLPVFQMVVNGSLTYDAKAESIQMNGATVSPVFAVSGAGVLTINSLLNGQPNYDDALIIRPASGSIQTEFIVNSGATLNINGARVVVSGLGSSNYQSIFFNKGSTINVTKGWLKAAKNQTRWGEQGSGNMLGMNINGLIVENIYTSIFGVFGSISGLAPLNSVTQMVSYGAFASTSLRDYAPLDSGSFLDNFDIVNLYAINSLGSGLDYRSGKGPGKWTSLQKEFTLKTLTAAGAAINGAVAYIKDTNNGGRVNIPAIPGQLLDNVYINSTGGAGITPVKPIYVMHAQAQFDYQSIPIRDYRTKTTVAGADLFDVSIWAYGYSYAALNDTPMKGTGVLALSSNLIADTGVTLTEAQAVAKLASSFTVAGNVLTVTANSTLSDLYDAMKAYKTRPVQAQLEYPSIGVQPVVAAGSTLTTAMTVVVNAGVVLSGDVKLKTLACAGLTITGAGIAGLTITGNVTQAIPTNLANVTITGTLTYNTATATPVTFTNVTAGTVSNSGAGLVTIKRVNSTLTAGANVVSYSPSVLTLTLGGGRIRILDNLGVEQYNQTADAVIDLPAAATGAWMYTIRKYGQQPIVGGFTVDGSAISVVAAYIPDSFVVASEAATAAYTALDSSQQIYDYLSLYGATAAGIVFGTVASKGFGTLTVPAGLTLNPSAIDLINISAGIVTTKTNSLLEAVTLISTGNILQGAASLSDSVALRAANLDSELVYSVDSATFYPTSADRNAGTNAGAAITGGLYRFKFGSTVSGVTLSGSGALRVVVGVITIFANLNIVSGRNVLDLGVQAQLTAIAAKALTLQQVEASSVLATKADVWAAAP